ncbi:MAG TPA: acetyltransferase [Sulfurovum sp. UBA12169]|nr:MAG TPA: acetyltransferase [Sulfurovum sp. UBA12169]
MNPIYIYGASGHGLVVAEVAGICGYDNILFIDDANAMYPSFEDISKENHIPIVIGVGNNSIRAKLFEKAKAHGFTITTLIHPSAVVSLSAVIGIGSVVMPNVTINAKASIGAGAILNTGSIIEHECRIGDFVHISPNAALAGDVKVGDFTHIGIGSAVIQGITIGKNTIIGAGSSVIKNIGDFKKAYGVPCKEQKNEAVKS